MTFKKNGSLLLLFTLCFLFNSCLDLTEKKNNAEVLLQISNARIIKNACDGHAFKNNQNFPLSLEELTKDGELDVSLIKNQDSSHIWEYTPGLMMTSKGDTILFKSKEKIHGRTIEIRVNGSVISK